MSKKITIDISDEGRLLILTDNKNALEVLGLLEITKQSVLNEMTKNALFEQKTT